MGLAAAGHPHPRSLVPAHRDRRLRRRWLGAGTANRGAAGTMPRNGFTLVELMVALGL
ncbi:prepilin-type N-terminal cleavage/methylation domain-containing protein, partial [Polymorphobacter multimanifer]|uniref:prepilin-type N-terminal cleavage/methylation domain-containing protein n=1 Tax=Polymorphobacter multimanifer TaxID=1070431 RepID=UPI003571205B